MLIDEMEAESWCEVQVYLNFGGRSPRGCRSRRAAGRSVDVSSVAWMPAFFLLWNNVSPIRTSPP